MVCPSYFNYPKLFLRMLPTYMVGSKKNTRTYAQYVNMIQWYRILSIFLYYWSKIFFKPKIYPYIRYLAKYERTSKLHYCEHVRTYYNALYQEKFPGLNERSFWAPCEFSSCFGCFALSNFENNISHVIMKTREILLSH